MAFPLFDLSQYKDMLKTLAVPNEYHENTWDLDLEQLKDKGFNTIVLDVDSTILSNFQRRLSLQHLNWIQKCKDTGFSVYILSNNKSRKRIKLVCEEINSHGYFLAFKPFPYTLHRLKKEYNFSYKQTIIIGDQILKDVFLANWVRAYSVLVKPLDKPINIIDRLQRQLEHYLIKRFSINISSQD